jgi:hypothetical protein
MPRKTYPIGSPEDFIINTLPKIVTELKRFLDITQGFLRDFQLDLELITAGTADAKQMSDDLQNKMKELQKEVIVAVHMTSGFQNMVDELKKQL